MSLYGTLVLPYLVLNFLSSLTICDGVACFHSLLYIITLSGSLTRNPQWRSSSHYQSAEILPPFLMGVDLASASSENEE